MCQPSQPTETTQTADLPDWAKPYAKDALAKGAALTDINKNPYQTYGGERIAGFQPMQQQAFETAANMQPSAQLGLGTGLAGAAGLGALGTNYQAGRFSGGQFGNRQAAQYMSPYIEQAMQPQLREAERASQIQGTQQQAQAAQAGAFGGSRDAIMRAERERNLGMLQGDIRSKGYQTAYEQAANQYNQDMSRRLQAQQLGEQSRQYGAGLGMQGLQTGLQAAGQLGQLGQTQYGQQMGINQLQAQYGQQQQAQAQRPLDMAYQDFLNQQNYPYKQLGYMSDLIRGLPLGQKSTSTVYEAPPSLMGQLGGLGMGAYGLSKMMAEGGEVKTYAGNEGSVTSQGNKDSIVDGMYSIDELQVAKEAALNRRDMDTVAAIDERIAQLTAIQAQSASLNYGLGSAFDQIPRDRQEAMMAGGGIIAFADRGAVVDPDELTSADYNLPTLKGIRDFFTPEAARLNREKYEAGLPKPEPKTTIGNRPPVKGIGARTTPSSIAPDAPAPKVKTQRVTPTIDKAITKMAQEQGVPKEDFMDMYHKVRGELQAESKEDLQGLQDLIDKQSGKSKEIKEKALGKALAEFGFNMAAQASKTGRESKGQGIAGLLGSAAAASPVLAASYAESEKLAAAADENDIKMQIEMRKYNIAARKNDSATAMSAAQNMRILQQQQETIKQQQAQLAETSRHNRAVEGLTGQRYSAISGSQAMKLAQVKLRARQLGQQRADNFFKNPNNFMAIQDMQKRGITQDALAKKFADEEQQGLLLGMVGTPTLDEE